MDCSRMLNILRISHSYLAIPALFASGMPIVSSQNQPNDFAGLIRTRADMQRTLERCDGNSEFETALSNWLEMAEPPSPADRQAIRETSLRLLEDTTDLQLVLGLGDGLLRHALADIK